MFTYINFIKFKLSLETNISKHQICSCSATQLLLRLCFNDPTVENEVSHVVNMLRTSINFEKRITEGLENIFSRTKANDIVE